MLNNRITKLEEMQEFSTTKIQITNELLKNQYEMIQKQNQTIIRMKIDYKERIRDLEDLMNTTIKDKFKVLEDRIYTYEKKFNH